MRTEPLAKALRTTKRDHRAFEAFYGEHVDLLLSYLLRRVYDLSDRRARPNRSTVGRSRRRADT